MLTRASQSQQLDRFPRSYTAAVDQPVKASFPPWVATKSAQAMGFHPGQSGPQTKKGHNMDVEGQNANQRAGANESSFDFSWYQ